LESPVHLTPDGSLTTGSGEAQPAAAAQVVRCPVTVVVPCPALEDGAAVRNRERPADFIVEKRESTRQVRRGSRGPEEAGSDATDVGNAARARVEGFRAHRVRGAEIGLDAPAQRRPLARVNLQLANLDTHGSRGQGVHAVGRMGERGRLAVWTSELPGGYAPRGTGETRIPILIRTSAHAGRGHGGRAVTRRPWTSGFPSRQPRDPAIVPKPRDGNSP